MSSAYSLELAQREAQNHRITELFRLQEIVKIIKSNVLDGDIGDKVSCDIMFDFVGISHAFLTSKACVGFRRALAGRARLGDDGTQSLQSPLHLHTTEQHRTLNILRCLLVSAALGMLQTPAT